MIASYSRSFVSIRGFFYVWSRLRHAMKSLPACFVSLLCGLWVIAPLARAETTIPDTDAIKHIGQEVIVQGTVSKVFRSKNGNIFLDFGGSYPDVTFVVWIPDNAPEAADPGLADLEGKKVKISGTIRLYKGKPEIKVSTKEQIVVE
jgi:DNA/RNA endonuclease YhcR with UshA esterase domain